MKAAVLAVVAVGALLRVSHLGLMEFKSDEQEALRLGIRLLDEHPWSSDHSWPAHGMISSSHVANAPLFNWIMALFWVLTGTPIGATALVGLINGISLYPLWLWARRRFDEQRALLMLAIVAVSPFFVIFSRKLWAQDLLLPGLLCVLWAIEWARDGRVWRAAAALGAATVLVGQLHQSGPIALALLPIAVGLQVVAERPPTAPVRFVAPTRGEAVVLVAITGVNLFFWLPYLRYFFTLPAELFTNRARLAGYDPALLYNVVRQIAPFDLFYFFAPDRDDFLASPVRRVAYQSAVAFGAPLAVYGVGRWLWSPLQLPVVGLWWLLVIAAFAIAQIPTYPFYVLILSPLPAVLTAGGFDGRIRRDWLARSLHVWRWAYVASLLSLTVLTGEWLARRGGSAGDYGVIYAIREAQANAIVSRSRSPAHSQPLGRGALQAGEPPMSDCSQVPPEVTWIVEWIGSPERHIADRFVLCSGWLPQPAGSVYRWTIRDAP
jgi:hypothetical protein